MYKYETRDIWIASALHSLRHNCKVEKVGVLPNGKDRYLYIFEPETPEEEEQLKIRLDNLNRKQLQVDVDSFQTSYKILRSLIFNN